MLIQRGLQSPDQRPIALTIGNFDGVHLGHQALLQHLKQEASARELQSAAIIFEPHPREFFTPEQAPTRLTSLREKTEMFAQLGLDRVHICRFDDEFAKMQASEFIKALNDEMHAEFVLIGDDFRFGSGRTGDFALMEKICGERGVAVRAMESVLQGGVRVSSTGIRNALDRGDLPVARRYLGRHYSISGHVEHGNQMGRKLGFPTANIQLQHNRPPVSGIFVVRASIDAGATWLAGAASLGVRPTLVAGGPPVLEVHLLDYSGDIYGRHMHVEFLHKLRDEARFPDLDSLTKQITLDVEQAKQWFKVNHGEQES